MDGKTLAFNLNHQRPFKHDKTLVAISVKVKGFTAGTYPVLVCIVIPDLESPGAKAYLIGWGMPCQQGGEIGEFGVMKV